MGKEVSWTISAIIVDWLVFPLVSLDFDSFRVRQQLQLPSFKQPKELTHLYTLASTLPSVCANLDQRGRGCPSSRFQDSKPQSTVDDASQIWEMATVFLALCSTVEQATESHWLSTSEVLQLPCFASHHTAIRTAPGRAVAVVQGHDALVRGKLTVGLDLFDVIGFATRVDRCHFALQRTDLHPSLHSTSSFFT